MTHPTQLDEAAVRSRITPDVARERIYETLRGGFDPASDPARMNVAAGEGEGAFLLMPSTIGEWSGVKVATVAPDNPSVGLPRIQASYLLFDATTLSLQLIADATSLTELRTPAVSAVAINELAPESASRLVVFGTGPQAIAHVEAAVRVREFTDIRLVGRSRENLDAAITALEQEGIRAAAGEAADVAEADVVICATTATEPLFDGELVRKGAAVIAIGSHEPDKRELDSGLMARSLVVVEDVATALREAGDVVIPLEEGHLREDALQSLAALVRGECARTDDRPNVFKGVGMAWQDLAVAVSLAGRE